MTRYEVMGWAEQVVWTEVEAETVEEAKATALELGVSHWDHDSATLELRGGLEVTEVTP